MPNDTNKPDNATYQFYLAGDSFCVMLYCCGLRVAFRVINRNIYLDLKPATRNPEHLRNRQTNKIKKKYYG